MDFGSSVYSVTKIQIAARVIWIETINCEYINCQSSTMARAMPVILAYTTRKTELSIYDPILVSGGEINQYVCATFHQISEG